MTEEKDTEMVDMTPGDKPPLVSMPSQTTRENMAALQDFKDRLKFLQIASVVASVMHLITTLMAFVCGFTKGVPAPLLDEAGNPVLDTNGVPEMTDPYISETLVVTAFGCLATCVFAIVETWRTLEGTSGSAISNDLPSWHWHNDGFLNSVGNIFFLCLFALPSVVVYTIHSIGYEFFNELKEQQSQNHSLFGIIMYHLLSAIFVFIVDGLTVLKSTAKLRTFQLKQEEEDGEKKPEEETDEGNDEENRPVENSDRILACVTITAHLAFIIDLIILSTASDNSGTISACIIMVLLFVGWSYYFIKARKMKEVTESWLLNFRLASIGHMFAFLLFFWMTLCVVLLTEVNHEPGFYQTLSAIADDHPNNAAIVSLLIICIFVSVAVYAIILYVHSRSMWSLDEIASLNLAARLQARLTEDRGD